MKKIIIIFLLILILIQIIYIYKKIELFDNNFDEIIDMDSVNKIVDTGNVNKTVDIDSVNKTVDSVNKTVDVDNVNKIVDTGNVNKTVDIGSVNKTVDTGNVNKTVDTGNINNLVEMDKFIQPFCKDNNSEICYRSKYCSNIVQSFRAKKSLKNSQNIVTSNCKRKCGFCNKCKMWFEWTLTILKIPIKQWIIVEIYVKIQNTEKNV